MHAQLFLLFKAVLADSNQLAATNGYMPATTKKPKKFPKSNLCFEFFLLYW